MESLTELDLVDNTILVFTSDHGDMLHSLGETKKQRPWDESIRVPFLLRYPALLGNTWKGISVPIDAPDIMPTLLGLCKIPIPETVEGTDFSELLIKDKMIVFGSAAAGVSSNNIETGKIMREMSNVLPDSVSLEKLFIKNAEPNILLSGVSLKGDDLSEFMANLENSPILEKVKLVFSEKNGDYPTGTLDFEITGNFTR